MWKDKLQEIIRRRERRNKKINNGCSNEELDIFKKEVKRKFNHDLPEGYIEFLHMINGLDDNGLVIYCIDDFIIQEKNNQKVDGYIETNEIWYENEDQKKYMFFGDGNISWYCYDTEINKYVELDKPSGELVEEFDTFEEMISCALESAI